MTRQIAVIGGGAGGFFGAIAAARQGANVTLFEKTAEFLTKVKISGGGRCNVTHACFEPLELSKRYPRGGRALIGAFHRFQPRDTIRWFDEHGVALKVESDGRMFPITDQSATVVDCLMRAATEAGVILKKRCGIASVTKSGDGFELKQDDGAIFPCDKILLATGGARGSAPGAIPASLGHRIVEPVPSLFTFHINVPWVKNLAGISVQDAAVKTPGFNERGPILFTHWGLSGPAVLRLSAWGAREFHDNGYHFALEISWLPEHNDDTFRKWLQTQRAQNPGRTLVNSAPEGIPTRLWSTFLSEAGIAPETRWAILRRENSEALVGLLLHCRLEVAGKSLNKDEFVTCGGVPLSEVNFKTMESKVCPGLYCAGEVLDIDGVTGGFNFQAAWTTAWIAGHAMAE